MSFLHAGSIGDVWASLPGLKEFYKKTGYKALLYLINGQKAIYYEGATHPTKNEDGDMVMLNESVIKMMMPLLREQEYIADVKIWNNQPIDVDLNRIREQFVGMPNFCISRWYFYVYPDLACDLSKQWMYVPETDKDFAKNKIIISRTERYNNETINYSFLKKYEDEIIFTGTMREYNNFCINFDLNVKKLSINNFLELAQAISQSKFHISNQTMAFQISQGILHPRILELCRYAPNVLVRGENAFDFFSQAALEYYVDFLYKQQNPVL